MSYGLLGFPLHHTFSPAFFQNKFIELGINEQYKTFSLPQISQFPELLHQNLDLQGLNVTIPYKQTIMPYLETIDVAALKIGAVNCVKITNCKTIGYNTDIIGFENSLLPLLQPQHTNAIILGTGGAAHAIAYVLNKLNIPYLFVSRNQVIENSLNKHNTITYFNLNKKIVQAHKLIINTTPTGMFPKIDEYPNIPYQYLNEEHLLYDLIYNPLETQFLQKGKLQGTIIKNGLEMLHLQADASWEIWNKKILLI